MFWNAKNAAVLVKVICFLCQILNRCTSTGGWFTDMKKIKKIRLDVG